MLSTGKPLIKQRTIQGCKQLGEAVKSTLVGGSSPTEQQIADLHLDTQQAVGALRTLAVKCSNGRKMRI